MYRSWFASALRKARLVARSSAGPRAALVNSSRDTRPSWFSSTDCNKFHALTFLLRIPSLNSGGETKSSLSKSNRSKTRSMATRSVSPGLRSS
eukprot:Skav228649  [mRNA]  locus=scaffold2369:69433:70895:- [translate_table: standard]